MDPLVAMIDPRLRQSAVFVDQRLIRRIIKVHRHVSGLVPHGRCYAIARDQLLKVVSCEELGVPATSLPEDVALVARPALRELRTWSVAEANTRLWRAVFHARVHASLERTLRDMGDTEIRRRIEIIGATEFEEIRAILRHDDLLLPPASDVEVYIEFASQYLELRHFMPSLLIATFPGLEDFERIDQMLGDDVDVAPLLSDGRPDDVVLSLGKPLLTFTGGPMSGRVTQRVSADEPMPTVTPKQHQRLLANAAQATSRGDDLQAALLATRAGGATDPTQREQARECQQQSLQRLRKRLERAVKAERISHPAQVDRCWSVFETLIARAARDVTPWAFGKEGQLLHALQRAAVAHEQADSIVDVASWLLSLGRVPVVRTLEVTREVHVARQLRAAAERAGELSLEPSDARSLLKLLGWLVTHSERVARDALRGRIGTVLDRVELVAREGPERISREKLIEELLDQVLAHGFLSFGHVRDALSRSQLKLTDLRSPREWLGGDQLIRTDAALTRQLDGIYRRGDIYLRGLQRLSSLPFGTRSGRAIALYLALPLGGAFIILEGLGHMVNPLLRLGGVAAWHPLSLTSLSVTAAVLLALLHSQPFRAFSKQLLEFVGVTLAWVFFRIPRAILTRPVVQRWLERPGVRLSIRRIIVPAAVAGFIYLMTPIGMSDEMLRIAVGLTTFVIVSALMGTQIGSWLETMVDEQLAPTWHVLSRQWLPGLFGWITELFAKLMQGVQRVMVRVDEAIRIRHRDRRLLMVLAGAVGFVWALAAYWIRLYVTLLVEPEVNPLKHFPIVTVAHKALIPVTGELLIAFEAAVNPVLGSIIGGAFAGVTVFLLPSTFGFLAWELKENYKLYRATRPDRLGVALIGPRGESMRGLLVPGFHSGTLPKMYERLRRAAQVAEDSAARKRAHGQAHDIGLARFRGGLVQVEQGLRRFVERELIALLHASARWSYRPLRLERVDLSSNRVRLHLSCASLGQQTCEITFEQHAGRLVAAIPQPGFLSRLQQQDSEAALLFENALAGFYDRAEVDLVTEQLEAELGAGVAMELADEGLVVWPRHAYDTELVYRIDGERPRVVAPKVRGKQIPGPLRVLDLRRVLYRHQQVSWLAWVAAWAAAATQPHATVPRLVSGPSILPGHGALLSSPDQSPVSPPNTGEDMLATVVDPPSVREARTTLVD